MYSVRPFAEHEWQELKAIRLEALQNETGNFGASYEKERAKPDSEWQKRLQDKTRCYFALCCDDAIIGMTGIYLERPEQAVLIASYIRTAHRGKGLSRLLYQARLDWAVKSGARQVIVSHRKSNLASMRANRNAGFEFTHQTDHVWQDGVSEPQLYYVLLLDGLRTRA